MAQAKKSSTATKRRATPVVTRAAMEKHKPFVPENWIEERQALRLIQLLQQQDGYELAEDEKIITNTDLAALEEKRPTAKEHAEHKGKWRGQYKTGDTRAFIVEQEQVCWAYNSWMTRGPDGTPRYHSEPPE